MGSYRKDPKWHFLKNSSSNSDSNKSYSAHKLGKFLKDSIGTEWACRKLVLWKLPVTKSWSPPFWKPIDSGFSSFRSRKLDLPVLKCYLEQVFLRNLRRLRPYFMSWGGYLTSFGCLFFWVDVTYFAAVRRLRTLRYSLNRMDISITFWIDGRVRKMGTSFWILLSKTLRINHFKYKSDIPTAEE